MPTTTTTTKRYQDELRFDALYPKRADGLCRCGCGLKLPKGRRSWATDACSAKCVTAFLILKGDSTTIRRELKKRDKGICATCGMDTLKERRSVQNIASWHWDAHNRRYIDTPLPDPELEKKRRHYMRLGFPSPNEKSWWEADHILEVVNGGGACGLENFQTLCCACHRTKTTKLASDRAAARRAEKQKGTLELLGLGQICPKPDATPDPGRLEGKGLPHAVLGALTGPDHQPQPPR